MQKEKKAKRKSMEDKIDTMSNTLMAWQQMMMEKGLISNQAAENSMERSGKSSKKMKGNETEISASETTIYHNVLDKQVNRVIEVDPEIMFRVQDKRLTKIRKEKAHLQKTSLILVMN